MNFLVIFIIFFLVMGGFLLSLRFSRYKQRPEASGCCGGGHCQIDENGPIVRAANEDKGCCKKH